MKPLGHVVDRCPQCGYWLKQRTIEQNSKFHAQCHEIAERKEWDGGRRDPETWKRLLVAAYERARGREAAHGYTAIDGQGIDFVYRHTHRFTKEEASDLIEWVNAWMAEQGMEKIT